MGFQSGENSVRDKPVLHQWWNLFRIIVVHQGKRVRHTESCDRRSNTSLGNFFLIEFVHGSIKHISPQSCPAVRCVESRSSAETIIDWGGWTTFRLIDFDDVIVLLPPTGLDIVRLDDLCQCFFPHWCHSTCYPSIFAMTFPWDISLADWIPIGFVLYINQYMNEAEYSIEGTFSIPTYNRIDPFALWFFFLACF